MAEEMFKTTLMGGFNKDDVQEKVQKMKDETAQQQLAFKKEIEEKEQRIAELQKRLELKEANQERLEREIHEKYQKYVDNYETIGRVALEAQLRADKMIEETQEKCDKMVADAEAKQKIADAELEIDGKLLDGKKKYLALQEEMSQIVELINSAQKHFADSYNEVHKIIDAMPTSFAEMEGVESEFLPETEKEGAEVETEVETETELETEAEAETEEETEETQEIEPLDEEDEDLDALDDLDENLDDLELTPLEEEEEEEEENSEALDEDEKIALQISKLLNQEDQYMMENEEE